MNAFNTTFRTTVALLITSACVLLILNIKYTIKARDLNRQLAEFSELNVTRFRPGPQSGMLHNDKDNINHSLDKNTTKIKNETRGQPRFDYALVGNTQELKERGLRRYVEQVFGSALATLHLTPRQLAEVKRLLVERMSDVPQVIATAKQTGIASGNITQSAFTAVSSGINAEIEKLVGVEDFSEIQKFEVEEPYLVKAESYNAAFSFADADLSPDQLVAFANTLANTQQISTPPNQGVIYTTPIQMKSLSNAILASSQNYLSSDQTAALSAYMLERNAALEAVHSQERQLSGH